ncbi:hypothetical protein ACV34L_32570, partial [Pseudomonas aeruginosa]
QRGGWRQRSSPSSTTRPRWAARRIAVVLQEFPEDFGLAVEDVVAMGRTPHKGLFDGHGADDRQRVRQA